MPHAARSWGAKPPLWASVGVLAGGSKNVTVGVTGRQPGRPGGHRRPRTFAAIWCRRRCPLAGMTGVVRDGAGSRDKRIPAKRATILAVMVAHLRHIIGRRERATAQRQPTERGLGPAYQMPGRLLLRAGWRAMPCYVYEGAGYQPASSRRGRCCGRRRAPRAKAQPERRR